MVTKSELNPRKNDIRAMRYEPEFLKECMRIKEFSNNAYKYLRFNGFLPLPSFTTLQRIPKAKPSELTAIVQGSSSVDQLATENAETELLDSEMGIENVEDEPLDTEMTMSISSECEEPESSGLEVSKSPEIVVEILSAE